MPRLLVFQHVAAEPLGTLDRLIRQRGHRIKFVNFEREPDAQPCLDRYRGLVVLGGPMNVEDQERRPHLKTELRAIETALAQNKPVLGICLGAQLLAHVLGAPVQRHRETEIGWYDVKTTEAGRSDPVLAPLGAVHPVFQWHSYTFEVPRDAHHLAETASCANQAFRYGQNAYGFQFHLEANRALIERWLSIPSYRDDMLAASLPHDEAAIRARTASAAAVMEATAERVFNNFLDLVGRPARRILLGSSR
ncbi:type 1 glutamine amidotransferase [Tahibacter amnicola]|uniref:Type 1 glutamine amidotransferase n=1 Tax=Tahibacter amnicola TaxID=2976241 RepID=A0ABY6BAT4_9GAMM|nr:type 1 glutamine amidotransferase [Tahibacter amnicola]UXI67176.1 type 1 glutamine amidotransferase [Tahibacter amnicola]